MSAVFASTGAIATPLSQCSAPSPHMPEPIDIVILTNGPGEVTTWVKPVVQAIAARAPHSQTPNIRISVILSPCPHASGQEPATLAQYPEVSRVQSAPHFLKFLLTGKTADAWDWHPKGVVVFLGGDQLYTVLVAKRLGYRTVTYAEWDARWPSLIDHFGVMQPDLIQNAPARYRHKFELVGDLMADVQTSAERQSIVEALGCDLDAQIIGLLPGSKPLKLVMGMPFMLAVAQYLYTQQRANEKKRQFVIGVSPNLTLAELLSYLAPRESAAIASFNAPKVTLIQPDPLQSDGGLPYLQLENGPKVFLWQRFPALDLFSQCTLCFTTIGANTAQLGALAIPMVVVIPTQELDGLSITDGWVGLLSRLPGIGAIARNVLNPLLFKAVKKSGRRFAWPNIWAKREVVPELFGTITPIDAAQVGQDYLTHPEKLEQVRQTLRDLRGSAGAANKMADLILRAAQYAEVRSRAEG